MNIKKCSKCGREFETESKKQTMCNDCKTITYRHWIQVMIENNLIDWEKYREDMEDEEII